jgi:trk system potassium uptake protein TrkH
VGAVKADRDLPQRYRAIFAYTGMVLWLSGLFMFTPLIALIFWPEEADAALGFVIPALMLSVAGGALYRFLRPKRDLILNVQDGGIIVLLSWVAVCLLSAWPLMNVHGLGFTQAVFEAVSGWTTTGLSVVDVTQASHLVLLWRSLMQFAGGAGLAIIMISTLAGPTGPGVSMAEGRAEQLVPHVRRSARLVMMIYTGYVVSGTVAYWLAGMAPFDAVNHSFAALSTGGFSTRPESIGFWDSPMVEAVTIVLMILGNLSFITSYLLLRGNFRAVRHNGEVRLMAILIPISVLTLLALCWGLYPSLGKTARVALFETVTALTTTGFSTVGYDNWKPMGVFVLIVLMLIGGGTCSTAGGIKQYRVYLLSKVVFWELRRALLPRNAVVQNSVWVGDRKAYIDDAHVRQVAAFLFLYLATFIVGSGILAAHGYGLSESLFEFASAVGTVGLSVGVTAPDAPSLVLWTETLGMFLGRLEFFVIFISVAKLVRDGSSVLRK